MSAVCVETHELNSIEGVRVKVDVWDDGDVDIYIGNEEITVANLKDIVEFVARHGQVPV